MRDYARTHLFDSAGARKQAEAEGKVEAVGPMLRVRSGGLKAMEPYTKFISLDGKLALQVMYTEEIKNVNRFCQFTIVENNQTPLPDDVTSYLTYMMFGHEEVKVLDTGNRHVHLAFVIKPDVSEN